MSSSDEKISLEALGIELPVVAAESQGDLETAARAALAGGEAASAYYGSDDLVVHDKGHVSPDRDLAGRAENPVTRADHAANDAILGILRAAGGDPVLSEESKPPADVAATGRLWVVDPLDGTKEFIARNGEFSVMVGLARGGEASLGAVYQPAVRRLYLGSAAGGAWVVDDPDASSAAVPLRIEGPAGRPLRLVRSRSHPDPALLELETRLAPVEVVISGSVGIKCARIACGRADLYVHPVPYLKEWDTCAPEAILRGAGGRVTDCSASPLRYGKADPVQEGGIFCARPDVHEQVAPIVTDVAKHLFAA